MIDEAAADQFIAAANAFRMQKMGMPAIASKPIWKIFVFCEFPSPYSDK